MNTGLKIKKILFKSSIFLNLYKTVVVEIPLTRKNGRSAGRKLVILDQENKVRIVHEYEGGRVESTRISQADLPVVVDDAAGKTSVLALFCSLTNFIKNVLEYRNR